VLERLLAERPPQRIGCPRVSDRAAFTAIVFVLVTGVPWRMPGGGAGVAGVVLAVGERLSIWPDGRGSPSLPPRRRSR
jgi:hypothetical protein